ncbi:NADP(+)-dependent dehydrogenase [Cladophialophora carrionii]|uniref:NADP(+)-dependent dehydrogenase n=1 Tax=Cladophialophora carrionii TaxID=86049 RepID=A0A1C1CEA4_9EURO|nr:NADP(+)-dependent dehydrogenase [Cladophialophora carrionii]
MSSSTPTSPRPTPPTDPAALSFTSQTHDTSYPFIDPLRSPPTGLRVLVTGASKGIGRQTALSFARSGASAIALLARSDLDGVASEVAHAARHAGHAGPGPKILKLQTSTTDAAGVERAIATVEREFGSLDVVVNNASRMEVWRSLADADVHDWWDTWEVNLKGTFLVTRATLPLVLKSEKGVKTMVVVTSAGGFSAAEIETDTDIDADADVLAYTVNSPSCSAYQGSKTAQIRFNDFLMREYGEQGLIAYAVHPGGVKTDVASVMPEWMHHVLTAEADLPADTLVWLTRERREWLAGRYVNAPWDMQELESRKDEIVEKDLLKLKLIV